MESVGIAEQGECRVSEKPLTRKQLNELTKYADAMADIAPEDVLALIRDLTAARDALKEIAQLAQYRNPRTGERPYCVICGNYEPWHKDSCPGPIAKSQLPEDW